MHEFTCTRSIVSFTLSATVCSNHPLLDCCSTSKYGVGCVWGGGDYLLLSNRDFHKINDCNSCITGLCSAPLSWHLVVEMYR